ncbi:MAG TPA: beta-ketoacyl-ACP synthase 3 [Actinomycetota bacterium]|nr:beta-ketoacyl-ACP synthase 3 [Actinomycetota bacterium]
MTGAAITGVGTAVPERAVSSSELEDSLGLEPGWIAARTGIESRRIASASDSVTALGAAAARDALDAAGLAPRYLDYVIVATTTPDDNLPAAAPLLQHALGCDGGAFDLAAGCSGFLVALAQADALVRAGSARHVLVAGVDLMSRIVDFSDPKTGIVFGDGAGAAVVSAAPEPALGPFKLHSDGSRPELLTVPHGGTVKMAGREVYRRAVQEMTASVEEAVALGEGSLAGVDLVVAHQANARILAAVAERLGLDEARMFTNIERYGNTSAASIPLALREAQERGVLREGDRLVLAAFGAGFVWGAGLARWTIPSERVAAPAEVGAALV